MGRTDIALRIAAASAILGIAGNLLLRSTPWGFGFAAWTLLLLSSGFVLMKIAKVQVSTSAQVVALHILAFAGCIAWRDSDALKVLNLTAILVLIGVVALRSKTGEVWRASIAEYTALLVARLAEMTIAPVMLLVDDIDWKKMKGAKNAGSAAAIGRGILIAAPILLVFGGLMASAGKNFSNLFSNMFRIDGEEALVQAWVWFGAAFVAAAIFRQILVPKAVPPIQATPAGPASESPPPFELPDKPRQANKIGITEIGIVFGALNLLFAAFVFVQFKYLFAGAEHVHDPSGPSFAEYAKKGFFELVWVSVLALPLVLGAHALLRRQSGKEEKIFRGLASVMILLLFVVVASAAKRLDLYVDAYGLTMQRITGAAALTWMTLSFVWLLGTVMRGKENYFAFGSLVSGLLVIFSLNAINPDYLIARTNLRIPNKVDVHYLSTLSTDAAPAFVESYKKLKADDQKSLLKVMQQQAERSEGLPPQSKNMSRLALQNSLRAIDPSR